MRDFSEKTRGNQWSLILLGLTSGTSKKRRAKGLAKFVRYTEVSLHRGSFPHILLLLEWRYPGCQRLFLRGFQFLSSLYGDPSLRSKRFLASSSRKLGREQKKGMTGEGGGATFFFCSRSNFRAITTRLETLATQAMVTRAKASRLRPTAEDVWAFGQHRKFPPHARKTSGTQGRVKKIVRYTEDVTV